MSSEVKVVGKTKAGKEIGYRMPDGKNLYEISFKVGGQVPDELKGGWNDLLQMTNKIKQYIEKSKPPKMKFKSEKTHS